MKLFLIKHNYSKDYNLTIDYNNILNYKIIQLPKIKLTNNLLVYLKLNNTKLNYYIENGILNILDFFSYEFSYDSIDLQVLINIFNNITKKDIIHNNYIMDNPNLIFFKIYKNLYSLIHYLVIQEQDFDTLYKVQINNKLIYK